MWIDKRAKLTVSTATGASEGRRDVSASQITYFPTTVYCIGENQYVTQ